MTAVKQRTILCQQICDSLKIPREVRNAQYLSRTEMTHVWSYLCIVAEVYKMRKGEKPNVKRRQP